MAASSVEEEAAGERKGPARGCSRLPLPKVDEERRCRRVEVVLGAAETWSGRRSRAAVERCWRGEEARIWL